MNKNTQKHQLDIQYRTLNKVQTDSFRHEMVMKTSQYLNNEIASSKRDQNVLSENSEEKNIFIKKNALERTISVYQWRHKTCYPVVKPVKLVVKSFTANHHQKKALLKKNSQSPFQIWNLDQNIYEIIVITEKLSQKLSQIGSLPLPQLFYLLKQILVGFQCLIDIFGLFEPTEDMIVVNSENEWRFWISEDFASNSKKQSNITEAQFILKILKMVESRLQNSKLGLKFFDDLKNLPVRSMTFLNLLDMVNVFIAFNKVIVSKKFVPSHNQQVNSLYGSKNQSYFGYNRSFNQFKDTPKAHNDKTFTNFNTSPQALNHHVYSGKFNNSPSKIKNFNCFNTSNSNRNVQMKKEKQLKAHMKISELYSAEILSKNNIEKRASFLFASKDCIQQKIKEQNVQISQFTPHVQKQPLSPKHALSHNFIFTKVSHETQKKHSRPFSPIYKERKLSLQKNKSQVLQKIINNVPSPILKTESNERKNSYYQVQRPVNKQAFSQSPKKQKNSKIIVQQKNKQKQALRNSIRNQRERNEKTQRKKQQNRSRKYSQHIPKIKSLDEFAKNNKKMVQSNLMEGYQQNQYKHQRERSPKKSIEYKNLKNKDITSHTRNATISGMAFGLQIKKNEADSGKNNINNDLYNGKFQQIMRSIKSKSNQGKEDKMRNDDFGEDFSPQTRRIRRATTFEMAREAQVRKNSLEGIQQIQQTNNNKPIIRISNANNQTAETLNKSELQLIKGSQQSNSISNKNVRQSDSSNEPSHLLFVNRKGLIGQSNLSMFSCKTYQPSGKKEQLYKNRNDQQKYMTTSQDCFNKNQSDSSQQFLKSNNWNKKISGLFSDVASIKVLKQSNHFGDELDVFEKEYLKDVKLEKLDKFGKQLKGSLIETEDGHFVLNLPTRGLHNKSFSLIGQVKEEPYENDPSYLEYSTSMICQSKHQQQPFSQKLQIQQSQKNMKNCESFEQMCDNEQGNNGFNFTTELYKITHPQ